MVAVSVEAEMERLRDQVPDRGERKDGADNSLRLPVHSTGQAGRKFLVHSDRFAALGKGVE